MKKEDLNKSQEVQQRIKEMTEKKMKDLSEINEKKAEAQTRKEEAEARLKEATELMNLEDYEKAKDDIRRAKTAIDMYSGRYKQISQQEYISEEESDKVIDELLDYERELDAKLTEDIKEPLERLQEILRKYFELIDEAERTIRTWETTIHANYTSRGLMQRIDETTGQLTDRYKEPRPVHSILYGGCKEAVQLKNFLKRYR